MSTQVILLKEKDLTCKQCRDTLFTKENLGDRSPYETNSCLWYADEELVCDNCGWEIKAGNLSKMAKEAIKRPTDR